MGRADINETYLPFDFFQVGRRERPELGVVDGFSPGGMYRGNLDVGIFAIILAVPALNHGTACIRRLPIFPYVIYPYQQAQNYDAYVDHRPLERASLLNVHEVAGTPKKDLADDIYIKRTGSEVNENNNKMMFYYMENIIHKACHR
jgi:hypothetical protein